MNEPYTTPQVADIVGISQRKLLSYIEREYVAPSVLEASGHGSKRLWSYNDLVRCATIKLLSGFLSVKTILNEKSMIFVWFLTCNSNIQNSTSFLVNCLMF